MDGSHDVLAADGTLAHPFAALCAGDHVTTLQQDTVNGTVHADLTEVLLLARRSTNTTGLWGDKAGTCSSSHIFDPFTVW